MFLSEKLRPFTYDMVLGNEGIKNLLEKEVNEKKSTVLYGGTGCGKSTLARIYLPNAKIYDGTTISKDDIRYMNGNIIIDEVHKMNNGLQQMLGEYN